jgi:hypothetical protein
MKSAPGPMEIPNWQSQIIKTNQTVSNQAAVNTGGANPIAVELYNMDKRQRQQIAVALKSAGYRVPTNGTFSDRLLNAYNTALQSAQLQLKLVNSFQVHILQTTLSMRQQLLVAELVEMVHLSLSKSL